MLPAPALYAIGFAAQLFFSMRTLVQWVLSERARKVLSPSWFWIFSLCGSWLLCIYGYLRSDFAIVLGQVVTYYIYLWNLQMKGVLGRVPVWARIVLLLTPVAAAVLLLQDAPNQIVRFFRNADIPLALLLFGTAGQIIFTLRFVYQWLYSARKGESALPAGFWIISILGAIVIVTYGIVRCDAVLIVGNGAGLVVYVRNLCIEQNNRKL